MVVEFEEALRIVLAAAGPTRGQQETLPLLDSLHRVLAQPVLADRDQPGFNRSTRDGYAVRAEELASRSLRIVGQVRAGSAWTDAADPGCAVEIMTGAPVPDGLDAVVMLEHVERAGEVLRLNEGRSLHIGDNIVPRGREARQGDVVVPVGVRLGAAEVALAAACGYVEVSVFLRPRVAIVATGDELVELAETPGPNQIRNSNSYALAAMVTAAGGDPVRLAIARDTRDDVHARIAEGRLCHLLVFSGGVSMGAYDLVEEMLAEAAAEFFFTGVKMQPGKPVVFGRLPSAAGREYFFFGLPGNPVSTQVTFHCFTEMLLRRLAGEDVMGPRWAKATLRAPVAGKTGLTRLLPCRTDGGEVEIIGWQGSGDLAANARANCYMELLPGRDYAPGELVRVLLR